MVSTGRISRRYIAGVKNVKTVLRYYDNFILDPAPGGVPAHRVWRANSVFDPDFTLGGHQARGFDQYIAMYDRYTVTGATIKVYADNNAEQSGMLCVAHVRNSSTLATKQSDIMEYGMKTVIPLMAANSGSGGSVLKTGTLHVDIAKFLGIRDLLDDDRCSGTDATNPAEAVDFHVSAFPINTGDANPVNIGVEIEYEVTFHQPKNPTES